MRALFGSLLGVIAVGVLLIAYGLLNPRTVAGVPGSAPVGDGSDAHLFARPVSERLTFGESVPQSDAPQFQLRCEPGQRAIVRQMAGAAAAECVDPTPLERDRFVRAPIAYDVGAPRVVRTNQRLSSQAPRRSTSAAGRVDGRNWKKTALVIGGSTATGAGVGAIFGGKKGALIGAAIGGGASTLWEAKH